MSTEKNNYIFDVDKIERQCYLLLACIKSRNDIIHFCDSLNKYSIPRISVLGDGIEKRYLADLAIQGRMIDDLMKSRGRSHHIPEFTIGYIEYNEKDKEENLNFREACNKIIHAISIEIKNDEAILIGNFFKNSWKTTINLVSFIKASLYVSNRYDEDWDLFKHGRPDKR